MEKFVGLVNILQADGYHTYLCLTEQNGCVSHEAESRLKAYYQSVGDAGKAPKTEVPNRQPARQSMVVERELQSAKTPELSDLLEEWTTLQRHRNPYSNIGFSGDSAGIDMHTKLWEIIHTVRLRGNN